MRDTDIARRLREAGLRVIEVDGWQTRGSDSLNPKGAVNHHTAGPPTGATPSLNTCINGRPDLEGPLCEVFQSREPDGNDIAYVVAAGKANHAGEGGWKGVTGNSSMYGLEIEHTGVDPLPMHRQEIAAKIIAALWGGDAEMVCQHAEWAPGRKIDAAEQVDPNNFRNLVREAQGKPPTTKPPSGGSVPPFPFPKGHWMGVESSNPKNHSGYYSADRPGIKQYQQRLKDRGWKLSVDGRFGPETQKVTKQYQAEKGLAVDGLAGEKTWQSIWTAPIT